MKSAIRNCLLACACLAVPQLVSAQMMGMGMRPPDVAGVFNPSVGSGSAYEMVKKATGEKTNFDMAVVDKDSSGGYWMEISMQNPQMHGPVYVKELLAKQADDIVIQHVIVQMQGQPPIDMSTMMSMHKMQSEQSKADFTANAENLGTESVATPAGTFSCQHWRSKKDGTEVWLSDKVTPWKLVKMINGNDTMTLTRIITDAKTHITGTPVSLQEMMQQHMKRGQ